MSLSPPMPSYVIVPHPLSMKHVNALESKSAWVHIIVDLPPLIMMGNKKNVLILKIR
jgi:hypothetical protein